MSTKSDISGGGNKSNSASSKSELAAALKSCRGSFIGVGLVSSVTNILMLTGPFFMLELYDRVLPSRRYLRSSAWARLRRSYSRFKGCWSGSEGESWCASAARSMRL